MVIQYIWNKTYIVIFLFIYNENKCNTLKALYLYTITTLFISVRNIIYNISSRSNK